MSVTAEINWHAVVFYFFLKRVCPLFRQKLIRQICKDHFGIPFENTKLNPNPLFELSCANLLPTCTLVNVVSIKIL